MSALTGGIVLTVLVILLFGVFGAAIGFGWSKGDGNRGLSLATVAAGLYGMWIGVCLSGAGWVVYVVAHYVSKYW